MPTRRTRQTAPAILDLPASPGELRAALVEARRHWRMHQDTVRGHESLFVESVLGKEVRSPSVEATLDVARREAWLLGLVVDHLEARTHGRAPDEDLPPPVQRRVDELIRLLVWNARQYREIHGHLPHDGPFDRVLWAG